jgi:hypothetical protein
MLTPNEKKGAEFFLCSNFFGETVRKRVRVFIHKIDRSTARAVVTVSLPTFAVLYQPASVYSWLLHRMLVAMRAMVLLSYCHSWILHYKKVKADNTTKRMKKSDSDFCSQNCTIQGKKKMSAGL